MKAAVQCIQEGIVVMQGRLRLVVAGRSCVVMDAMRVNEGLARLPIGVGFWLTLGVLLPCAEPGSREAV